MRERKTEQMHYLFSLPYVVILVLFVAFYFAMMLFLNIDSNRYLITIFQFGVVFFWIWFMVHGYQRLWRDLHNNESQSVVAQTYRITNFVVIIFLFFVFLLGLLDIRLNTELLVSTSEMRLQTINSNNSFSRWVLYSSRVLFDNFYAIGLLIVIVPTLFDKLIHNNELKNKNEKIKSFQQELNHLGSVVLELNENIERLKNDNISLKNFENSVNEKFKRDEQVYRTCDKCCEAMKAYAKIYESRKNAHK